MHLIISLSLDGRQLRRCCTELLKRKAATAVYRLNYVKKYYLEEGKIQKSEEKIVIITGTPEKEKEIIGVLHKALGHEPVFLATLPTDLT